MGHYLFYVISAKAVKTSIHKGFRMSGTYHTGTAESASNDGWKCPCNAEASLFDTFAVMTAETMSDSSLEMIDDGLTIA